MLFRSRQFFSTFFNSYYYIGSLSRLGITPIVITQARSITVSPTHLAQAHGAHQFVECLRKYISATYPFSHFLPTSDDYFHVYKRLSITLKPLNGLEETERKDVICATPRGDENDSKSRFDTILVHESDKAESVGVEGVYRSKIFKILY